MPAWVIVLIGCGVLLFAVLPFIAVIAAIAVPTLVSTRNAAMQSFAQGVLSTIRSAEAAYYAKEGEYGDLDELANGGYVDPRFDGNHITGFDGREGLDITFKIPADKQSYECTIVVPSVGELHLDQTGEITGP